MFVFSPKYPLLPRLGTRLLHRLDLVAPRKEARMPDCTWERAHRDLSHVGRVHGALFFVAVCGQTSGVEGVAPVRNKSSSPS
jgi:hypothetical protein